MFLLKLSQTMLKLVNPVFEYILIFYHAYQSHRSKGSIYRLNVWKYIKLKMMVNSA